MFKLSVSDRKREKYAELLLDSAKLIFAGVVVGGLFRTESGGYNTLLAFAVAIFLAFFSIVFVFPEKKGE